MSENQALMRAKQKAVESALPREGQSNETGLATLETSPKDKAVQPTVPAISLELPAQKFAENMGGERNNQARMFAVREFFLQTPEAVAYAWVPQALEAFSRSLRSDLLPSLGAIRGIEIDPSKGALFVSLETPDGKGLVKTELGLETLKDYSLEQALSLEDQVDVPLNYSEAMSVAVKALPPDVQYRWNLITQAARTCSEGGSKTSRGELRVGMVGASLFSLPEGVGTFLNNGRSTHAEKFSLVKVTHEEVPLTEYEKEILDLSRGFSMSGEGNIFSGPLMDLFYTVQNHLRNYTEHHSKGGQVWDRMRGWFGQNTPVSLQAKFESFATTLRGLMTEASTISMDVQKAVFAEKAKYKENSPFELTALSKDLQNRLVDIAKRTIEMQNEIGAYVSDNSLAIARATSEAIHKAAIKPEWEKREQTELTEKISAASFATRALPASLTRLLPEQS